MRYLWSLVIRLVLGLLWVIRALIVGASFTGAVAVIVTLVASAGSFIGTSPLALMLTAIALVLIVHVGIFIYEKLQK